MDFMQMRCEGQLHFNLDFAVTWINIIKLFLAAETRVGLVDSIERFRNPHNRPPARQGQPQRIPGSKTIFRHIAQHIINHGAIQKHNVPEIEIIPHRTKGIADNRMPLYP